MCGRVVQHRDLKSYAKAAGFKLTGEALPNAPPRYNAAPSQELLVVRRDPKTGERRLNLLKWGLLPHWAEDQKMAWKLINARDPPPMKWSDSKYVLRSRRTAMARKRYKPEEIVAKLRQVEVLASQGQSMSEAIRQIGVSEVTYYRWRQEFGGLQIEQVKRLKELELENSRLRKAVSDLTLDKLILQEAARGNF